MSTNRGRMKKKGTGRANKEGVNVPSRIKPPQIVSNVRVTRVYRFRAAIATTQDISQNELINALGVMQTVVTTTATSIFNTVKVHRVSVWTPPDLSGSSAIDRSCTITWNSAEGAVIPSGIEVSDSTMSTAYPAHVSSKPPAGSIASFWLTAYSGTAALNLFTVACGVGSIIDVHCTGIMGDTNSASNLSYTTTAGPGLGVVWYPPLDGPTDQYLPVGLQTFT
jgi:hypothetical protein